MQQQVVPFTEFAKRVSTKFANELEKNIE